MLQNSPGPDYSRAAMKQIFTSLVLLTFSFLVSGLFCPSLQAQYPRGRSWVGLPTQPAGFFRVLAVHCALSLRF